MPQERAGDGSAPLEDTGREAFVEVLVELVRSMDCPRVIGVYGAWGTGKTTFMARMRAELESKSSTRSVWMSLWEHEQDQDPVTALLTSAVNEIYPASTFTPAGPAGTATSTSPLQTTPATRGSALEAGAGTSSQKHELSPRQKLLIKIGVAAVCLAGGATALIMTPGLLPSFLVPLLVSGGTAAWQAVRDADTGVFSVLKDSLSIVSDASSVVKGTTEWAVTLSKIIGSQGGGDDPEQTRRTALEDANEAARSESSGLPAANLPWDDPESSLRRQFKEILDLLVSADGDRHRVVFFFDDLDRCSDETAVRLLERVKTYLDHPQAVFVLGVDYTSIRSAIARVKQLDEYDPHQLALAHGATVAAELAIGTRAADYLEKFVQYPFWLPPLTSSDIETVVDGALDPGLEGCDEEDGHESRLRVIRILAAGALRYETSLRQVKRLVVDFTVQHKVLQSYFEREKPQARFGAIGDKETFWPEILAVVVAFRGSWPEAYLALCGGSHQTERSSALRSLFTSLTFVHGIKMDQAHRSEVGRLARSLSDKTDPSMQLAGFDPLRANFLLYVESLHSTSSKGEGGAKVPQPAWEEVLTPDRLLAGVPNLASNPELQLRDEVLAGKVVWTVCRREKGRALLVAKHLTIRAACAQDLSDTPDAWQASWFRQRLSQWFDRLATADPGFTDRIQRVHVAENDVDYGQDPQGDPVFLLTRSEAQEFWADDELRRADFVDGRPMTWSLRSWSRGSKAADVVFSYGGFGVDQPIGRQILGIRPALWISVDR
ncbi:MAG: KAP family NTPase [Propionibacteriaceae bacterium]|nr:KAP family NTPase [Propionibacteriaceae bacterium]